MEQCKNVRKANVSMTSSMTACSRRSSGGVDDMRQERTRRQAQDRPWIPEDQKCEDGTPHCFHGWHIFNLQPYHVEK